MAATFAGVPEARQRANYGGASFWLARRTGANATRLAWLTRLRPAPDVLALSATLVVLAAVTAFSLATTSSWRPDRPPLAPWCLPGQTPTFSFGFAELAQHLGSVMGQPIECEHGAVGTSSTFQETTTGIAIYDACTNASMFERGEDNWLLTSTGLEHWSGSADPAERQPTVRVPDLRYPCPP